ncbi:hypothetical protein DNTS_009111 [Danionella cerebrum]|uniref:Protein pitchfork n=1 Tax=Danionella cerebrum TaxID=2873325 RepID=A0A553QAP1_9TELE|nr:hypothetical protein DNTS_009111 [Danionella translucida]
MSSSTNLRSVSPSPQKYQKDWIRPKVCPPGKAPFNSSAERFRASAAEVNPGPGAYAHEELRGMKVEWPMKFGSPDWSKVPMLEKRALRTELINDKDFRKQRNRVAYLNLFY